MKRRAVVVAGLLAAAFVLTPVATASAATAKTVPLVDTAGVTNGCVGTADLGTGLEPLQTGTWLQMTWSLECPASADVRRVGVTVELDRIEPDGTVRDISGPVKVLNGRPFVDEDGAAAASARHASRCASTTDTHQYRFRVTFQSKRTTTWQDPAPYAGSLTIKRRLPCTLPV